MYTFLETFIENEVVLKSNFIALLFHVTSLEEVNDKLVLSKKKYPKAKHYCYAYKINELEKGYDAGEPLKVASKPLLDLIKFEQLNEILIVVVRYFGGSLLGAARLSRTYRNVANSVIKKGKKYKIAYLNVYPLEVDYSTYELLLKDEQRENFRLENVSFSDTIKLKVLSESDLTNYLRQLLKKEDIISLENKEKAYLEVDK
ncbi:MAG: YigZ family protein [Bacilli bacterium]|jgi:putative IMPACT (imprinted ancient) family translation regulator|nr:YigZ family protein [Erysipelotrichia bacterium]